MWDNFSESEELVYRAVYTGDGLSVTEISKRTDLPTWKVSRNLKRLEIRGIVQHEEENRKRRGRPCKFYEITPNSEQLEEKQEEVVS